MSRASTTRECNSYTFNFFRPLLWGLAGWAVAGPPVQNVPPGKVVQDEEDVEKARLQFMNKAVERIGDVSVATVGVGVIIETFAMGTGSYEAGRQGENAAEYIMGEPPAEAAPAVPPEAAPAVPPEAPNGIGETFKNPADAIGDLQGEATEVVGSRQATTNEFWAEKGFTEHRVYQDSNGDFHHLFYNPKTGQFSGGGLSSHE